MCQFQLFALVALLFVQTATDLSFTESILNSREKEQLARATNIEKRIKVYTDTTKRIHHTLHQMATENDFAKIPETLQVLNTLLNGSLKDIEANLKAKKKSRPLIRYEIQTRKILTDAQQYKTSIPAEQEESFKSLLAQAEKVRKRFVDIIFNQ